MTVFPCGVFLTRTMVGAQMTKQEKMYKMPDKQLEDYTAEDQEQLEAAIIDAVEKLHEQFSLVNITNGMILDKLGVTEKEQQEENNYKCVIGFQAIAFLLRKGLIGPEKTQAAKKEIKEEVEFRDTDRAIKILQEHGIGFHVSGCGCCDSPWVRMTYKGETIIGSDEDETGATGNISFDTDMKREEFSWAPNE